MNIVEIWPHGDGFTDREAFEKLYYGSFPENELRDLGDLMQDKTGAVEFIALYEDDVFAGFMTLLNTAEIVHIIYFAIEEELRGRGCGSRALRAAAERYPGKRIIVDVELPEEGAKNRAEREKRIAFYERNGYRKTELTYNWRGENYVILSHGGNVTESDWDAFWRELEQVTDVEFL